MNKLIDAGRRLAEQLRDRKLDRIEAALRAMHLETERAGEEVVARARGLSRRWLLDPALRFIAWAGQ